MLQWFKSFSDSSPLGSAANARKFVAALDRDLFAAEAKASALLRDFVADAGDPVAIAARAPAVLAVQEAFYESIQRLERDYLAASHQTHSLLGRLWDAGYGVAMRCADASRVVLMSLKSAPDAKLQQQYAQLAVCYFNARAMAYRYRLYRHEEWVPNNWRELHDVFRKLCDIGLDHVPVTTVGEKQPTHAAHAFVAVLLLRLGNAGGYMPTQTFTLSQKMREASFDARLTARPMNESGFVVDLSGTDGFVSRSAMAEGGHFLFCDTSAIYGRMMSWLDAVDTQPVDGQPTQGAGAGNPILALRSAVLRVDPEFKPLARASQRNTDQGRVAAVSGIARSAGVLNYGPRVLMSTLGGTAYGYADALEIQTLGMIKDSTIDRLRQDLPPEAAKLKLGYWHLRDRSDTGFRCVLPHTDDANVRLRDIAVVSEEEPHTGWQVAIVARLLKLPANQIELGLQVLTRDAGPLELRTLRTRPGMYRDNDPTLGVSAAFKGIRLKGAFFGRPIMDMSWIMATSDYNAGLIYEMVGSNRRYEARNVIAEGSDWIWVQPSEFSRDKDSDLPD
jgi:hypothetical protein